MDWFKVYPTRLQADVRLHGLSLEAQGLILQLLGNVAQYDAALPLTALLDEVRPPIAGKRREALLRAVQPVLTDYLADIEEQVAAYAEKSEKARAAGRRGGKASARSRASAEANASPNAAPSAQADKRREERSPLPPKGDDGFDRFWRAYPKKAAKGRALKAWRKLAPDATLVGDMLAALDWQRDSSQWTSDGGKFVPYPSSWLNDRRWEDARPADQQVRKLPAADWEVAS